MSDADYTVHDEVQEAYHAGFDDGCRSFYRPIVNAIAGSEYLIEIFHPKNNYFVVSEYIDDPNLGKYWKTRCLHIVEAKFVVQILELPSNSKGEA